MKIQIKHLPTSDVITSDELTNDKSEIEFLIQDLLVSGSFLNFKVNSVKVYIPKQILTESIISIID